MVSFARYLLTAGIATCIDVAIVQGLLFLNLLHQPLFLALVVTLGGLAGVTVNFLLSRRFVFAGDARPARQQFVTFALVAFSGLGLRLLLVYGLVAALAWPGFAPIAALPVPNAAERLAHLGAVALVTVYSFLAHKHISFGATRLDRLPRSSVAVH